MGGEGDVCRVLDPAGMDPSKVDSFRLVKRGAGAASIRDRNCEIGKVEAAVWGRDLLS